MPHDALFPGGFEVTPLCDGWAPLPLADECPGQRVDWNGERQRHPWAFVDEENWAWHVHSFLVRNDLTSVLVDTGIGHLGRPPYDVESRIDGELASVGADPSAIDTVVHTHLHADHAGGACLPDGTPRFPNAQHHVHPGDWEFFAGADGPEDFNGRAAMTRLWERGVLDLDPSDHEVAEGISLVHSPGHTPGHRSVLVRERHATLLLTGDLLHVPPQVGHPEWPSGHDVEPEVACAQRERLLHQARDEAWLVGVSHFGRPFGRVSRNGWLDEEAEPGRTADAAGPQTG
jgi:glyoxylase-like metal-dependent hydrolase (beta-lactamase superfamily II)